MKKSIQLIGAVALLASLSGSEANAQSMSGDAAAQGAVTKYPRFHTANSGAGIALGDQTGGQGGGQTAERQDLSGSAAFRRGVTKYPRFHNANSGANLGLGGQVYDPQQGQHGDPTVHVDPARIVPVPDQNLADDIIVGSPFVVYAGPSAGNPVLMLDAGIVPDDGSRVIKMAPNLPDGMSTYFRSGDVIICVHEDLLPSVDEISLNGPGSVGLGQGKGAFLTKGSQSLTTSTQVEGALPERSRQGLRQGNGPTRDQDVRGAGLAGSLGGQGL